jgi:hypothetical protein
VMLVMVDPLLCPSRRFGPTRKEGGGAWVCVFEREDVNVGSRRSLCSENPARWFDRFSLLLSSSSFVVCRFSFLLLGLVYPCTAPRCLLYSTTIRCCFLGCPVSVALVLVVLTTSLIVW